MTHSDDKIELNVPSDVVVQAYIDRAHRMRSEMIRKTFGQAWTWLRELVQRKPRPARAH